ncbi:hypothetical protein N7451_012682 [Penicillium sp. IBT 35674x]|nr:hypothetical protein N7451_012682 [Penicillium sp. IBT 35674x]
MTTSLIHDESDFDLDLHAIWRESSGIPTPPPCLATDHGYHDFDRLRHFVRNDAPPPLLVECCFHLGLDHAPGFNWTGPDPLALSTQPEDLFLHLSEFCLSEQIHWVEFRLTHLDQVTGEMIGEHLFFLPLMETVMGNLRRVRGQMLDIIAQSPAAPRTSRFRLSLWPHMEPLPYASHSVLSPSATLPTMPTLDPSFFVHNLVGDCSSK